MMKTNCHCAKLYNYTDEICQLYKKIRLYVYDKTNLS